MSGHAGAEGGGAHGVDARGALAGDGLVAGGEVALERGELLARVLELRAQLLGVNTRGLLVRAHARRRRSATGSSRRLRARV